MPTPHHLRHPPATLSPSPYHPRPHPSSTRTHPILNTSQPSFYTPPHPSSAEKLALPRLKQAVTHLWKSFVPKEEEDLSSTSYPDDIMWITL